MSGHSKFANIKHKKERNDSQRGKIFTRLGREIAVAVKESGSDPSTNRKLKDIIAKSKAYNMPNDTIDRSIRKAAGDLSSVNYEVVVYEGYGPNGIAIIVEAITDNKNRTASNVRNAYTKGGGNMGTTGCVSFLFDKKGQILFDKEEVEIEEDELMMLALDSGAQDFSSEEDMYEVLTDPDELSEVYNVLIAAKLKPVQSEVTMIPQTWTPLTSDEDIKKMNKLIDLLDEDDDVQAYYHNWENQ